MPVHGDCQLRFRWVTVPKMVEEMWIVKKGVSVHGMEQKVLCDKQACQFGLVWVSGKVWDQAGKVTH